MTGLKKHNLNTFLGLHLLYHEVCFVVSVVGEGMFEGGKKSILGFPTSGCSVNFCFKSINYTVEEMTFAVMQICW